MRAYTADKIVTPQEVVRACGTQINRRAVMLRSTTPTLVFTNGCFDILHPGHIDLLEEAADLGEALVVGLNSDESVSRLKGPRRPRISQMHRAYALAALACVDYVVFFDEDTPINLINTLQPDILVKGDDYNIEDIVGAEEVMGWGGTVHIADRLTNPTTRKPYSTTGLIEEISGL